MGNPFRELWTGFWGDFADRYAHHFSPAIFILLAIFLGFKQNFENPLDCWTPAEFSVSHVIYTNEYCQTQNIYFPPMDQEIGHFIPLNISKPEERKLLYDPWTPVLLLWMGLAFLIPGLSWKSMAGFTSVPFPLLLEAVHDVRHLNGESREKSFKRLAGRLGLDLPRFHPDRISGILLYLTLKIVYLFLWWSQIERISSHFGTDYHYPLRVFGDILEEKEWEDLDNFPVITMCDFEIRSMGNIHRFTVQCFNSIHALMPVLAVLIHCWLFIGIVLALASLIVWLATAVLAVVGPWHCLLLGPLAVAAEGGSIAKSDLRLFLSCLSSDAIFLLRVIQTRVGVIPAQEIVNQLWTVFRGEGDPEWKMMTDEMY